MDNKMKIELNRDQIKYIAVFTMLLNHVANIFLQPGTFACEALKDIGYLQHRSCAGFWLKDTVIQGQ